MILTLGKVLVGSLGKIRRSREKGIFIWNCDSRCIKFRIHLYRLKMFQSLIHCKISSQEEELRKAVLVVLANKQVILKLQNCFCLQIIPSNFASNGS